MRQQRCAPPGAIRFAPLRVWGIAFLGAWLSASAALAATISVSTIALSGQSVPGLPGVTYSSFGQPQLADSGDVLYTGVLAGTGVSGANNSGLFQRKSSGPTTIVARKGDPAPGTIGGETYGFLSESSQNDAGQVGFSSSLTGAPFGSNRAVYRHDPGGATTLIARLGDQPPGLPPSDTYFILDPHVINSAGQMAFRSDLSVPAPITFQGAVFGPASGGALGQIARVGATVAPLGPTVTFATVGRPDINDLGQVGFHGRFTGTVASIDEAMFVSDGAGSLSILAQKGNALTGPGFLWIGDLANVTDNQALNGNGDMLMDVTLTGLGVNLSNDRAILSSIGGLSVVAREGDPVPGDAGNTYSTFPVSGVELNDAGDILLEASTAFGTAVLGPDGAGGIKLITRASLPIPALLGTTFLSLSSDPLLNEAGDVVFTGHTLGSFTGEALFRTPRNGSMEVLLKDGDLVEVAAGDFRTIDDLELFGSAIFSRPRTGLNELPQIAVKLTFTDTSTGIFVVTVPEPSTLLLLVAGLAALALLQRRKP